MAVFPSRKYRSTTSQNTLAQKYRSALARHPFALFGLPFIATMLLGSFFLTPATALRYERHDRKVKTMTQDEALGIGKDKRRIDLKEEYYVSMILAVFWWGSCMGVDVGVLTISGQKLAAKDLDNWEQKRVKRLPGEHDGVF